MDNVPLWLFLSLGFLFFTCWLGGIGAVIDFTRDRGWWPRWLWRAASILFPINAFVLFVACDWLRRRDPARRYQGAVGWKWEVAAHVLFIALAIPAYVIARDRAIVHVGARQTHHYRDEWWFSKNGNGPPALCLAMSGGGIRSAAFNIGVLRALHENGLLAKIDVMSAVSGGAYALSWYLLQQYYAQQPKPKGPGLSSEDTLKAMFDWDGVYQQHLAANARQFRATDALSYYAVAAWAFVVDLSAYNVVRLFGAVGNENLRNFSFTRSDYRESLQSTFQLAKHPQTGDMFNAYRVDPEGGMFARAWRASTRRYGPLDLTVVEEVTFAKLAAFAEHKLPFFVFVTTVDVDAADQPGTETEDPDNLWPSVFELNAWGLGSDSYGYKAWAQIDERDERFAAVRLVNVAPAISGAALSPAAGGVSAGTRRVMSLGNVDLGYLVPRFNEGESGSLYLSDGGHSENLGLYPLVRRDCQRIVVVDAEHEPDLHRYRFKGYYKVRKALLNDVNRTLQIDAIEQKTFDHATPVVRGEISSSHGSRATPVFYVKLAMDKARNYGDPISNPGLGKLFPQDPTSNQNFDELQFRAYRELGYVVAREAPILKDLARERVRN